MAFCAGTSGAHPPSPPSAPRRPRLAHGFSRVPRATPPERPGTRRSAAQRDLRWCRTCVSGMVSITTNARHSNRASATQMQLLDTHVKSGLVLPILL
jgi:hypothetical protein